MKKIIFFLTLQLIGMQAFSQITLEHSYENAGYFKLSTLFNLNYGKYPLYIVHLEVDGDKYVKIDKEAQTIEFYNLDHTLWKNINYSNVAINVSPDPERDKIHSSILYISQNLFDSDSEIELMYSYSWFYTADTSNKAITQIVNEDGSILFSRDAAPTVLPTFHNQHYPIYNTSSGTKMILSNVDGTAEIFSLVGTFTAGISQNNILGNAAYMSLSPNPSTGGNMITINYTLPEENKSANLLVIDSQGRLVKSYKIGDGMSNILVNPSEFSKGTYFYFIQTPDGKVIANQKSIIIE